MMMLPFTADAAAVGLARYFVETLGVSLRLKAWAGAKRLPLFLTERYDFLGAELLGQPCLFMVDKSEDDHAPAAIRKHLDQAHEKTARPVVYVRAAMTAYDRRRLIEHRVPFVVPGNQMYLPGLGIDFREHFRKARRSAQALSPAAQVVALHALQRTGGEELTAAALTSVLGFSAMTLSRAFDQLEAAKLGEAARQGRERRLRLVAPKAIVWERAQPYLQSPVRRRHHARLARGQLRGVRSGLSALARYSMLAEPDTEVIAMGGADWKERTRSHDLTEVPTYEPGGVEVEVWSYDPALLAENDVVDRLSLYLSLRGTADERTEAALDEVIGGLAWE